MQGGFIFAAMASCLQWPATQNGHWSASAFFYASMLLAFITVVLGSQQMLVLPKERSLVEIDGELKDYDEQYLQAVIARFRGPGRDSHRPNRLQVAALQAPFMVLSLSVLAFLAGMCSVVFAPLARAPVWGDNAKVSGNAAVPGRRIN